MARFIKVIGDKSLRRKLRALEIKSRIELKDDVIVGYTADYAILVHENMTAHHPVGNAKYLENPFREMSSSLGNQIAAGVKGGMSIGNSMLKAGLRLQRESQKQVPVDTGNLKSSAFTRKVPKGTS